MARHSKNGFTSLIVSGILFFLGLAGLFFSLSRGKCEQEIIEVISATGILIPSSVATFGCIIANPVNLIIFIVSTVAVVIGTIFIIRWLINRFR